VSGATSERKPEKPERRNEVLDREYQTASISGPIGTGIADLEKNNVDPSPTPA